MAKHIVKYGMITWLVHDISEESTNRAAIEDELRNMFRRGKFLILLDALDETAELFDDVCNEVEEVRTINGIPHAEPLAMHKTTMPANSRSMRTQGVTKYWTLISPQKT